MKDDAKDKLKRALVALKTLKTRVQTLEEKQSGAVAIVGMACRFPGGAEDLDSYWELLREGRDASSEVPRSRWPADFYYDPDPEALGKMYTKRGSFLSESVESFDPGFFGISPREAKSLSPEQRLLLEVSWEALEHGGFAPERLAGSQTGMFLGIGASDYSQVLAAGMSPEDIDPYCGVGQSASVAAGRISFALGLRGPTVAVDTACSSSLVALDLGLRALRAGECGMALVAGASMILSPFTQVFLSKLRALSPDGRCKTFDASADGFGRGEGCGVIVLKRLRDAIENGDTVYAIVRGSSVNHDGRSAGLTVPNGSAQEAVIKQALSNAGVTPADLDYVEAHGTGTQLGDPIEARSISNVFGKDRSLPLRIGSVKTNIGHLEAGAGMASIIKVALALKNGAVPAHLHFSRLNQHAQLDPDKFQIPTELSPWEANEARPRLAGISAFSLAGTNAHVVLEEAPRGDAVEASQRPLQVFPFSNQQAETLDALATRHQAYLAATDEPFADICRTAGVGRSHFSHRMAVTARTAEEAADKLARGDVLRHARKDDRPIKIAFVFPSECDVASGTELIRESAYCEALAAARTCAKEAGVNRKLAEPLCQYVALAALWRSWGVEPFAAYGEGVGELAAAYVTGALSLEDAFRVIDARKTGDKASTFRFSRPRLAFVSSVTGNSTMKVEDDHWYQTGAPLREAAKNTLAKLRCEVGLTFGAAIDLGIPLHSSLSKDAPWDALAEAVAEMYVAGAAIDWDVFSAPQGRRKVALPHTPYARKRLWLDEDARDQIVAERLAGEEATMSLYGLSWHAKDGKRQPVGQVLVSGMAPGGSERPLSITSDEQRIVQRFQELAESGQPATVVVMPTALTSGRSGAAMQAEIEQVCRHLVRLVASWKLLPEGSKLVLATTGAQSVGDEKVIDPAATALWGFCRTLAAEHPELSLSMIDGPRETLVKYATEFAGGPEQALAFRDGQRYVLRLMPDKKQRVATPEIDGDALYAVTGGFGGVGRQVTEALVAAGAKHVLLIGRRGAAGADEWVQALTELGVTVNSVAADVATSEGMSGLKSAVQAIGRPLRGLVHAAGVLEGGLLSEADTDSMRRVFAPKIAGTWNLLTELSERDDISWVSLFSSAASVLPSPGLGNYGAANAFLDGAALTGFPFPVLAINWGPWEDTGMAQAGAEFAARLAARGNQGLAPDDAAGLMTRLIGESGQRAVLHVDWPQYLEQLGDKAPTLLAAMGAPSGHEDRPEASIAKVVERAPIAHRLADAPKDLRAGIMTVYLQELGGEVMGRSPDEVSVTENLLDTGFDSLMAMDLLSALRKDMPFTVEPREFYERPSIHGIALLLTERFNAATGEVETVAPAELPALRDTGVVADAEMREVAFSTGEMTLNVCQWGDPTAPPLMLLHGLQDQAAAWHEVAIRWAAKGFYVVAPDHRGHGKSEHVGQGGDYHIVDLVKDADLLCRSLKGPVHLVGHSMGAGIAALLASARPQHVASLTLIEPPKARPKSLLDGVAAYLDSGQVGAHAVFPDVEAAAKALARTAESMSDERAMELAKRIVEPCEGGVRWSWDPRLRASAGLALSESFAHIVAPANVLAPMTIMIGARSHAGSATYDDATAIALPGGHNVHHDCPVDIVEHWMNQRHAAPSAEKETAEEKSA